MGPLHTSSQGFSGKINLQLTDLIQMVCLSRSDITIVVTSSRGSGTIYIKDGQICHVETDILEGEPALLQLFQWKDGQFEVLPYQDARINSVNKSWEYLVLEAMRLRDEEASGQELTPHGALAEAETEWEGLPEEQDPAALRLALEQVLAPRESGRESLDPVPPDEPVLWERNGAGPEGVAPGTSRKQLETEIDQAFDEIEVVVQRQAPEEDGNREGSTHPVEVHDTPIRVLVVDDSTFFARQLKKMLEADLNIEVVGTAKNGKECIDFLASRPAVDLITLDVQMPVMKGDTTLKHIMIRYPMPSLMISTFQTESLSKIFEFLQVGAIDFISKPDAHDDIVLYGERLRDVVKRSARSDVSRFKRWRKPKAADRCSTDRDASAKKVLVILGAEGAYMDWFRLPLAQLCRTGLVVGFQKLPDLFVGKFSQLIEEGTGAGTAPLWHSEWVGPGKLYFGNGGLNTDLKLVFDPLNMGIEVVSSETLSWYDGIHQSLRQLAGQARGRMSVYMLSGAQSLSPDLVEELAGFQVQMISSPPETVMCGDLIESIRGYSKRYPKQITWARPEDVMEVWSKYEGDM